MPQETQTRHLMLRVGILTALSAISLGAFSGVAAADSASPVGDTTTSQSQADDGATEPTEPTDSVEATEAHRITFGTPRAATSAHAAHVRAVRMHHAREVRAVLREAERQKGKPYSYGGAGPRAFDCSGFVMFVFGKAVGRSLPHNAAAQYQSIVHIKRSEVQPGDLVFQESGGVPFHVGIYSGHGKWWHSPHSGQTVRNERMYHGHKFYGRVLTKSFANRHVNHRHGVKHA
jgi:cell wall-associated NlpC family hydrolase